MAGIRSGIGILVELLLLRKVAVKVSAYSFHDLQFEFLLRCSEQEDKRCYEVLGVEDP